ncbi:GrpE nucleotide exchange factor [Gilbertella persicaria]|uniref:GrpE nucleotide exchange factor n=1 Tax=Gilbertella persicaria TaxID=101096 RepID=UPI002220F077|nr:GrpE nucleotide exchange factor [Gilbertella persicaria]KAI8087634.1 GrpE nucleotide exchange factor [Gilbertella persicaria]
MNNSIRQNVNVNVLLSLRSFSATLFVRGEENDQEPSDKDTPEKNNTNKLIEEELAVMSTKLKELQSNYLLSLADQENLRQRHQREIANAKDFAIQKFAKELVDSIDILKLALQSVPGKFRQREMCLEQDKSAIVEQLVNLYTGVSMTEAEFKKMLTRFDIQEDNPIDQPFDPNKHEAVFQIPAEEKKPGTVVHVQKVGYTLKNRVLRPAQVGVVAEK